MFDTCVILTGGKSSRMGMAKSLLPFGEKTLIEILITRFHPLFKHMYLSVNEKGMFNHLNLEVEEIEDIYKECGPLGGLYSIFTCVPAQDIFFMSIDMPFLSVDFVSYIMSANSTYDISVLEREHKKIEPLAARYSKNCLPAITSALTSKSYKLMDLLTSCNTLYLPHSVVQEACEKPLDDILFNMNTKELYEKALKMQH